MSTTLEATTKDALILTGSGYSLEVAPDVIEQKAELIKHSALIVTVNDAASSAAAGNQIKKLAAMRNLVEGSRKTVKAPVLDVGRQIDALASDFQTDLTAEEARLKKLQGDYAMEVERERQRVLREMEAARQAEAKRIADEEAKQRAAHEAAEKARIAAEEAEWNASSPEDEAKAKAAADAAAVAEAEAKRLADERIDVIAATPPPVFVPEAPKGVKMIPDFEVIDLDALYRHNVGLVKMEPRREEILRAIAGQTIGDTLPTIPGLRVFLKPQVR